MTFIKVSCLMAQAQCRTNWGELSRKMIRRETKAGGSSYRG